MTQRYTLDKASSPGWTLQTDHIFHVREALERGVCKSCRQTKAEWDASADKAELDDPDLGEDVNPWTFSEFFPENYADLPDAMKIDLLLSTACGCEYWFEDAEEGKSE